MFITLKLDRVNEDIMTLNKNLTRKKHQLIEVKKQVEIKLALQTQVPEANEEITTEKHKFEELKHLVTELTNLYYGKNKDMKNIILKLKLYVKKIAFWMAKSNTNRGFQIDEDFLAMYKVISDQELIEFDSK